MGIKGLLVHLDQAPATQARLLAALAIADRFGAQVTALHLVAEPFMPGVVGHHMPADILREHLAHAAAEAEGAVAAARAEADRRGVALVVARESGPVDRLPHLLARHARHADLVIVGRPDPTTGGADDALLAEAAFMDSGRPALLIPPEGAPTLPPRCALIAWDGSREAARAVSDALPLLQPAERVVVLVVDGRDVRGGVGQAPGVGIVAHLTRHEVSAEVKQVRGGGGGGGTAEIILAQAKEEAADLLVMGGYGHSRLREMMLGGVTRHMLEHATVPLLLSH
jgi:nucleotide-binding universal stress UspA family protein